MSIHSHVILFCLLMIPCSSERNTTDDTLVQSKSSKHHHPFLFIHSWRSHHRHQQPIQYQNQTKWIWYWSQREHKSMKHEEPNETILNSIQIPCLFIFSPRPHAFMSWLLFLAKMKTRNKKYKFLEDFRRSCLSSSALDGEKRKRCERCKCQYRIAMVISHK